VFIAADPISVLAISLRIWHTGSSFMSRQIVAEWTVGQWDGVMTAHQIATLKKQLKAVVPALVELRAAGYLDTDLDMKCIAANCTLDGLRQLARDRRLSEPCRHRCEVMRDWMIILGEPASYFDSIKMTDSKRAIE
jgi:hypothetical protein